MELEFTVRPKPELITNVPPSSSQLVCQDSLGSQYGPKHLLFCHTLSHVTIQKEQLFRVPGLLYFQNNPNNYFFSVTAKQLLLPLFLWVLHLRLLLSTYLHETNWNSNPLCIRLLLCLRLLIASGPHQIENIFLPAKIHGFTLINSWHFK